MAVGPSPSLLEKDCLGYGPEEFPVFKVGCRFGESGRVAEQVATKGGWTWKGRMGVGFCLSIILAEPKWPRKGGGAHGVPPPGILNCLTSLSEKGSMGYVARVGHGH